jgi:tetratricopeptide (TPR) repeat protein/SAM-dependent methyltransferase
MSTSPPGPAAIALLNRAIACHQGGRLADAEQLYLQVLAAQSGQFDAQHLLGVLRGQQGRYGEALQLVGAALGTQPDSVDALSNYGLILHKARRNDEALASYDKALALNPRHAGAHSNRGNVLSALKRYPEALSSYDAALAIRPHYPEALNNRGNVLKELKRFDDAVASYDQALALRPGDAEVFNNRGLALLALGRHVEAVASFDDALASNPAHAEAYTNRGHALVGLDRHDEALESYRRALAIRPDDPAASYHLGNVLAAQGRLDEAVTRFREALEHRPDFVEALTNLATALMAQGRHGPALDPITRAMAIQETAACKALFVDCVRDIQPEGEVGELKDLVLRALSELWARPNRLSAISARLVKHDGVVKECIARALQAWPGRLPPQELLGHSGLHALARDLLLQRLLISTPVVDIDLERFLTAIRSAMLDMATDVGFAAVAVEVLSFCCALARQCFINDYVFAVADGEAEKARGLQDALAAALDSGNPVPAWWLAVAAAYGPLYSLSFADQLAGRSWPEPVAALLRQQITEPQEERAYRASIPSLTAVADGVSAAVRQQYEDNPYPRWVAVPASEPTTIVDYLLSRFPLVSIEDPSPGRALDVLIAGCGTGQHSIVVAQRLAGARVLAVDLSLTSLGYAMRKSRALGQRNIDYAQADILNLDALDRSFDVIESSGVLHHLAQPMQGWRVLMSRLRPGGFMKLGLYSALARRDVVAARTFIAARGYGSTADDIRRCRQELMGCEDGTPLRNVAAGDFFTTSGCRDLLFHVQESRLTLPEIDAFLKDNDLELLGFEIDGRTQQLYRARFPADRAMTDLAQWHVFETDNPTTFLGMYQFWIRKSR